MITVLHNKKFLELASCFNEQVFLQKLGDQNLNDFEEVAKVDTDALDIAYLQTNHIRNDWSLNLLVTVVKKSRSTSVGDVLIFNGRFYGVAQIGFVEIKIKPSRKASITDEIDYETGMYK